MAFTTQIFVFVFFPLCMVLYLGVSALQSRTRLSKVLKKIRALDIVTIGISLFFYMWASVSDVYRLAAYIVVIYFFAKVVEGKKSTYLCFATENNGEKKEHKMSLSLPILILSILLITFILLFFKHTSILVRGWNYLFKDNINAKTLIAPLGISFITFSAISYVVDVYNGKAKAGSIIDCALYITFFPKIVSGPIVLWKDFKEQIHNRNINLETISNGVLRIMIGFAKKVILADVFGAIILEIKAPMDAPTALLEGVLFTLQIYYDFSGYSDIAIGIASIMGFSIKENFNFPYLSCSITEFWRRWHISLGTWFREYVYIPLGGNKKGLSRTVINIMVVFFLTGFWHGATITYILWGILNGVCNVLERLFANKKIYKNCPKFIKWALTMCITFFCWQLFRFGGLSEFVDWLKILLGITTYDSIAYTWQYFLDLRLFVFIIVGVLFSTIFGLNKVQRIYARFNQTKGGLIINSLIIVALFILALMFMVNSNYMPFLYFQY